MLPWRKPISISALVLVAIVLATFTIPASAARARAYTHCPFDIWCAIVKGCPSNHPNCDHSVFHRLSADNPWTTEYIDFGPKIGVSIKCSREQPDSEGRYDHDPIISQLEWNWDPEHGKTWFDISNVDGRPFTDHGMTMYVNEARTAQLDTCLGGTCRPGHTDCLAFYQQWDDDQQGMRACSPNVDIDWHICLYDARMPEYMPTPPTAQSLGFLAQGTEQ